MTNPEWEEARKAAVAAAAEAWRRIAPLYETGSHVEQTAEGPSTEADKLADKIIGEELRKNYPPDQYGYLTEETEDDRSRLDRRRVWIIDPIDGTKDFIKKNGAFAIHIGMAERFDDGLWHPVAAAVYRPHAGEMYSAVKGAGSQVEPYTPSGPAGGPRPLRVSGRAPISQMKVVISNSHRSSDLNQLVDFMNFAEMLSIGSIGIKLALIARGDYDVYVNLARGKCREWDICAPDLILTEAGGILTGLDGSRITYNKEDVYDRRGLLASNAAIHPQLSEKIAEFERRQ
ncbi:3'(2'),5'-bisphosphate nucleotidase CysQ [Candidatus Sumerlaeota bacterium]|nr:3'(2'),5'-bisphosphate nucleotidase CysQ [Candidatus Sumerlaeota bacterium]